MVAVYPNGKSATFLFTGITNTAQKEWGIRNDWKQERGSKAVWFLTRIYNWNAMTEMQADLQENKACTIPGSVVL